jgi:hypothetical protein
MGNGAGKILDLGLLDFSSIGKLTWEIEKVGRKGEE